jgi:hypothetical protein
VNGIQNAFVLNALRKWLDEQDDFDGYDTVFGKLTTRQVRNKLYEIEQTAKLIPESDPPR